MADQELTFKPATELRRLIAERVVSPVELVDLYLTRIERLDGRLNSYLTVASDQARAAAREAEAAIMRGGPLGPLHGLPISIKDLEMTDGIRTTSGSLVFKDRVPQQDSIVVERVRAAGAIILGKTNTPEFGLSGTTENRLGDACRNPWDPSRTAGGSSGGAAASVAAGLCALATGTDGGGSIRIPASFCGTFGIKGTQGRVPRYPAALPAVANQLSQPGPITRTVADAALLLQVLAGYDPRDPVSLRDTPDDYMAALKAGARGLRIGWSQDYGFAAVDPEVVEVCQRAAMRFRDLGSSVHEVAVPLDEEPFLPFWTLFATNMYAAFGQLYHDRADELTEYGRETFAFGASVTGVDYARAVGAVEGYKAQFDSIFERCDLLLSPTMAVTAFPIEQRPQTIAGRPVHPFWGFLPFTYLINMIGHPAASIPCGLSTEGLPVGLHIVGRRGDEGRIMAAAAAFEAPEPLKGKRPPVS